MEEYNIMEKYTKKRIPIYTLRDISETEDMGVDAISLVEQPAIGYSFMAFSDDENIKPVKIGLSVSDTEKQVLSGVIMIADIPIYRVNAEYGEHYIVFSKDMIYKIVQKYFKQGKQFRFNISHDQNQFIEDTYLFESYIIDRERGVYPPNGYETVPNGSWFGSVKIENKALWDTIKKSDIYGFSIEGLFEYNEIKKTEDDEFDDFMIALSKLFNNNTEYKKKKKKRKYESVSIDGKLAYDSIEEALEKAEEMGCEGYHEHIYEETTYYMPCYEHDDAYLKFESYTDYPESSVNSAKRALDYKEANPKNTCGTRVGWTRANQLANKEPISEETIARMASFKRHQQNKDVPYSEGCGGLMWDAWGGTAGIEWASNKLESIRQESDSFEYFDNLPLEKQNYIIDHLKKVGTSAAGLRKEGYEIIYDSNREIDLNFDVNRSDANPNEPTSETLGQYKVLFTYSGPTDNKNRKFCARLMELDLLFRKEDIDNLSVRGANDEFGIYDIFNYKGSYNCRHSWNRVLIYRSA